MAACNTDDGTDCVGRKYQTVQVPYTRNSLKQYTNKVPRQDSEQEPRTVNYTAYESRSKQVPYMVSRSEKRTRMETQEYTVPVTTTNSRVVPVTKKVPKTIYMNVTQNAPDKYPATTIQTRERQVPDSYYVNLPETKYRTVTETVPVSKTNAQMETVRKTTFDSQVRTRCNPETKMVVKQIPVYNVVVRPAPSCPPGVNIADDFNRIDRNGDGMLSYNEVAFDIARRTKAVNPSKEAVFDNANYGAGSNYVGGPTY